MILAGGKNIFYSEDFVHTKGPTQTIQEIDVEIEKFQEICLLKRLEPRIYSEIVKNYRKGNIWEGTSTQNQ